MLAIISDIHSNTEALRAVLDDISRRRIKRILCLGDVIGYGPEPIECIDLVRRRAEVTLMGNHDAAVLLSPTRFNIAAENACFWTRRRIETETDLDRRNACWDFLGTLPVKHAMDGEEFGLGPLIFVHGSPRRPVNEYIFPDDVYTAPHKVRQQLERFENLCFVGHTHVPGVFVDSPDFYSPEEIDHVFEVNPIRKALINVGSVGQPRDRDPRAAYAVLEPGAVRFVRVPYDIDAVVSKVDRIKELDDYVGSRLREGR